MIVIFSFVSCESDQIKNARKLKKGDNINMVNLYLGKPDYVNRRIFNGDSVIYHRYNLGWAAPDDINIYLNPKDSTLIKIFSEAL